MKMVKSALQEILKQVQKTNEKVAKVQEGLESLQIEGSSGGGMVKAVANGRQEIIDIKIEKDLLDPDEAEMLEDLLVSAVNQALINSQELAQHELSKVTGGMLENLPDFLKVPGLA